MRNALECKKLCQKPVVEFFLRLFFHVFFGTVGGSIFGTVVIFGGQRDALGLPEQMLPVLRNYAQHQRNQHYTE